MNFGMRTVSNSRVFSPLFEHILLPQHNPSLESPDPQFHQLPWPLPSRSTKTLLQDNCLLRLRYPNTGVYNSKEQTVLWPFEALHRVCPYPNLLLLATSKARL